jgi:NTP pyrophosphatase (non-canonical NTP hydrolase)
LGEELADVALFLLGISEMLGIDLESEIEKKLEKNEKRLYIQQDGVDIRING